MSGKQDEKGRFMIKHGDRQAQWISKSENTRKAQQKLTLTQAILIRKLYLNAKISQRKFAKWINMPQRTFSDLITNKTYKEG